MAVRPNTTNDISAFPATRSSVEASTRVAIPSSADANSTFTPSSLSRIELETSKTRTTCEGSWAVWAATSIGPPRAAPATSSTRDARSVPRRPAAMAPLRRADRSRGASKCTAIPPQLLQVEVALDLPEGAVIDVAAIAEIDDGRSLGVDDRPLDRLVVLA